MEICDSLDQYFPGIERSLPLEFQEITLPRAVRLNHFADRFGVDADALRRLNPGYRRAAWRGALAVPAKYTLRLPLESDAPAILAALGAADAMAITVKVAADRAGLVTNRTK